MTIETIVGDYKDFDSAIVIALGSNLKGEWPSSISVLESAKGCFSPAGLKILECSSYWRSCAWPNIQEPDYINAIALVETGLRPEGLLCALHAIEAEFGRTRTAVNAPRVLDLDLIAYGRLVRADPAPILPHPRAAERRFVMGPLAEIAPTWRHPVSGLTAETLAAAAPVGRDAVPVTRAS